MAETKTKPTAMSVDDFLATIEPPQRRRDALAVRDMMARISGFEPAMWGPSIIGFGRYHYRYASGHEGDAARIGFSPRKAALVLYLAEDYPGRTDQLARLGKHTTGKACIYLKKLADIDESVLEQMIHASLADTAERYPA